MTFDSVYRFVGPAKDFYDTQPPDVQADLTAIATWLRFNPAVEGVQKGLIVVQGPFNVRQLRRVYHDERYWLWYELRLDGDGIERLFINDCDYI